MLLLCHGVTIQICTEYFLEFTNNSLQDVVEKELRQWLSA
jgi:hypothetical protein